ncbi:MAG: helicase-exonuclease AddAB subunit AddA [Oscillospiraceae bacterium]|nr:helicase-exonuclease AddAB subunit AddA [Oscillospiraceae bacterium]
MANWTPAQQDAIDARRGTVLVSAAAGSGKTAVLVERVIQRLCDPVAPTDADRLLIVTFTKAAAAEMKERIGARLSALLEASPGDPLLKRQQMLLRRAQISTIHSFCSRVLKEHFYKLGLSPDYTIADDSELSLLRAQSAEAVLSRAYEEGTDAFHDLVDAFSGERDDQRLVDTILRVYDFTCAHPFPEQWMEETEARYRENLPIEQTVWGKRLLRYFQDTFDHCEGLIKGAIALLDCDDTLKKAYLPALESDLALMRHLKELCSTSAWDDIMNGIRNRSFARFGSVRGYANHPIAVQIKALRQQEKDTIEKKLLPKVFSSKDCQEDLRRQSVLITELFRLVREFTRDLDGRKAQKRTADFSDLERWTLRLLYEKKDGIYLRTEEAKKIAEQFDEIIVDEYQDTNEAQDRIFRAVSKAESNLFLVGDVKQSIYGFRQAMPQIFLSRRSAYTPYDRDNEQYPACIVLDRNFRSRTSVTDTVNFLFRQLMTTRSGDVDYSDGEALVAGAHYEAQADVETELVILEADAVQDETLEEDMAVLEAREIAMRIHRMIGEGFLVTDGDTRRPVTYSDFCILLRSANNHMAKYVKELQHSGIPAKASRQPGFFQTAEVAVMTSFLRIISNPMQDIPLLSVLMSPIYGFTPDDLSDLRAMDEKDSLYLALQKAAQNGMERASLFLQDLELYRTMASTMTADRILNCLYERSGYCDFVQAMTNGPQRLANLQLLLEYARQFEQAGYHGVSGFVHFLDQLQHQRGDLSGAESPQDGDNAVKVMSIHNSKGLEFPVCIVAGCSRRFNQTREDALIHPEYGLGVKLRMDDTPCKYTTLMREAIAIANDREAMAEELRIFYVALTRAREKLLLVTTEKKLSTRLSSLAAGLGEQEQLDGYVVSSATSFSDWILTCALRHPDGQKLRELCNIDVPILRGDTVPPWKVQIVLPQPAWEQETAAPAQAPEVDERLLQTLRRQVYYQYPYADLLELPSKVTASALAEQEAAKDHPLPTSLPRPSFLSQKGLTPSERGTATHTFLQFCDFHRARDDFAGELQRLVSNGFLTKEQGSAVEEKKVSAFLQSGLFQRMDRSPSVEREYRFTAEIPAYLVKPALKETFPKETVVLQGAVDCVFVEDDELVIVDYKTDRIRDPLLLWQRYETQLSLYAAAMEQCTGKKVKEKLLYAFALDSVVTATP